MKVGDLLLVLMEMNPNTEIKVASADRGNPLVEDLVRVAEGFNVVVLQTDSFASEMRSRLTKAIAPGAEATETDNKPKLTLVN